MPVRCVLPSGRPAPGRVASQTRLEVVLLLLTRHGRTASNVAALLDTAPPGPDLDEVGRHQSEALVDRLGGYPIEAVYSSDLVRAVQTAQPLAAARELPLTQLPELREISGGDDELSPDLRRYIGALRAWGSGDPSVRIPGGETGTEFLARYEAAIRRVAEEGHSTALLVSHGAAIRTWTTAVMPQVHAEFEAVRGIPNTTVIVAEGEPGGAWELRRIDFPEPDPEDGFTALAAQQQGDPDVGRGV